MISSMTPYKVRDPGANIVFRLTSTVLSILGVIVVILVERNSFRVQGFLIDLSGLEPYRSHLECNVQGSMQMIQGMGQSRFKKSRF